MTDYLAILKNLQSRGFRLTDLRKALVKLLFATPSPLTAQEIKTKFSALGFRKTNKTTIYRELEFLQARGLISEIDLGEGKKRYELVNRPHHHHAVCRNCGKIADVVIKDEQATVLKTIAGVKNFSIQNHWLEFFGLCAECNS